MSIWLIFSYIEAKARGGLVVNVVERHGDFCCPGLWVKARGESTLSQLLDLVEILPIRAPDTQWVSPKPSKGLNAGERLVL